MTAFGCRLMTILAAMLLAMPALAQGPHIQPRLVAESATPAAGGTTTLALVMKPAPTWHGYWKNPGDSGVETLIDWTLPAGASAGELTYPVPHTLIIAGLMNYVYEGEYAQLIELKVPAGLAPGTRLPIRGTAKWLACTEEICVPEKADIAVDLTVGDGKADQALTTSFARWRAAMPKPLGSEGRFALKGETFRIAVPLPAKLPVEDVYFFPLTDGAIDYAAPQAVSRNGDDLIVEVKAAAGAADIAELDGVLRIGKDNGLALRARPGEVPAAGAPVTASGQGGSGGEGLGGGGGKTIAIALAGAILGGLLLNVMPCVFPILSLKALSLARAGGDEREVRLEALAYTGGAVLTCLVLGGVLLALRAGGEAVGWAFQLQDPRVILVLLLLTAAIALNLAGLFELPAVVGGNELASKRGTHGAFWTGALAAFIATPCTGPFMGAALGAALVLPATAAMAIFAGLGLGLALPFLALGFIPALRRRLPRPGAWMDRLRRILAIPMFLTALGLAWLLGRLSGIDGMTLGLGAALLTGLGLWWVGRRQLAGGRAAWWPLAPALAASLALMVSVPRAPATAAVAEAGALGATPFSEAKLAELQAAGRPVFVYFTADWCLSCKVNEKAAIDRAEVAEAFAAANVAVLVGDWTNGDATIGRFLSAQGRSGVPLYLFYRPGQPTQVLPQVLTPGILTALAA
ncbi:Thiol:disulfide interchange protein [Sphingomonas laterariae]|uniref:Thiol:disulfide interchange protein n=1 Tax=Edaphosphingomonas laterariae TaxID=861865 RepID=A0A239EP01_9SPHN|nr:thioredoxin family protein [Sphingomonas laterariae]SNS45594.1 Thiol:disulfide interchange protein [Sphingomonas laterariae]